MSILRFGKDFVVRPLNVLLLESENESEVAQLCLTLCDPWTVAHQAPPSMGFSRQEYWSGLPFTGLGHKTVSKIFWTTCLTSLLVQENIFSLLFPISRVTLLPSSISYGTIYYFIRGLRHIFDSVRNSNFAKQVKYK